MGEAEFTMFDKVGKAAVGKPLLNLLKFRNPGLPTIQEIARVPMVDRIAPPEVTQIIGQKYKLLVSIAKRSFATTSTQLSFQVVKIMETYKPELSSSAFDCVPGSSGASSSASLTDSPVPSEMFTPSTPSIKQAQPGSSSGSPAITFPSPTGVVCCFLSLPSLFRFIQSRCPQTNSVLLISFFYTQTQTPTSKLSVGLLSSASPGYASLERTTAVFSNACLLL